MKKFIKKILASLFIGFLSFNASASIPLSSNFNPTIQLPLDERTVVDDITARNAIPVIQRYDGLEVYVKSTSENWQLQGGVTNSDWVLLINTGGGSGTPSPPLNSVQYNSPLGSFGGDALFTRDPSNGDFSVGKNPSGSVLQTINLGTFQTVIPAAWLEHTPDGITSARVLVGDATAIPGGLDYAFNLATNDNNGGGVEIVGMGNQLINLSWFDLIDNVDLEVSSNGVTIDATGDSYTFAKGDGLANQVQATDGAGQLSWTDVSALVSNPTLPQHHLYAGNASSQPEDLGNSYTINKISGEVNLTSALDSLLPFDTSTVAIAATSIDGDNATGSFLSHVLNGGTNGEAVVFTGLYPNQFGTDPAIVISNSNGADLKTSYIASPSIITIKSQDDGSLIDSALVFNASGASLQATDNSGGYTVQANVDNSQHAFIVESTDGNTTYENIFDVREFGTTQLYRELPANVDTSWTLGKGLFRLTDTTAPFGQLNRNGITYAAWNSDSGIGQPFYGLAIDHFDNQFGNGSESYVLGNTDTVNLAINAHDGFAGTTSIFGGISTYTTPTFTGVGLDDLNQTNNTFYGPSSVTFTITIDSTGTPDTFSWSDSLGNSESGIGITGAVQSIAYGSAIQFGATTGHTINDSWEYTGSRTGTRSFFDNGYEVSIGDTNTGLSGFKVLVSNYDPVGMAGTNRIDLGEPTGSNGNKSLQSMIDASGLWQYFYDLGSGVGNPYTLDINGGILWLGSPKTQITTILLGNPQGDGTVNPLPVDAYVKGTSAISSTNDNGGNISIVAGTGDGTGHNGYVTLDGYNSITSGGIADQGIQNYTSGSNVTVSDGISTFIYNPASNQATATITMPANPLNGQRIKFLFGGTVTTGSVITALTLSPNASQAILGTLPTDADIDTSFEYQWFSTNAKWYRID